MIAILIFGIIGLIVGYFIGSCSSVPDNFIPPAHPYKKCKDSYKEGWENCLVEYNFHERIYNGDMQKLRRENERLMFLLTKKESK